MGVVHGALGGLNIEEGLVANGAGGGWSSVEHIQIDRINGRIRKPMFFKEILMDIGVICSGVQ